MDPRMAAFDPLVPRVAPAPEVEQIQWIGSMKGRPDAARAAALAGLELAVELYRARPDAETRASVVEAVAGAQEARVDVNFRALVDIGAITPADDQDIDAIVAGLERRRGPSGAPDDSEPEAVELAEVDPLVHVEGMVPLYNPMPVPASCQYDGRVYVVRAQGVDLVSVEAARMAVGDENHGGALSKVGVRRLYAIEPHFEETAAKAGLSVEAWVKRRNAGIVFLADGIWAKSGRSVIKELD